MKHIIRTTENEINLLFAKEMLTIHEMASKEISSISNNGNLTAEAKIKMINDMLERMNRDLQETQQEGGLLAHAVRSFVQNPEEDEDEDEDDDDQDDCECISSTLSRNKNGTISMVIPNKDVNVLIDSEENRSGMHIEEISTTKKPL